MTGQLIYRERDTNGDGTYEQADFIAVDIHGNTIGLLDATDGALQARLWYTPSGEVRTAEFTGLLGGVGFDLDAFFTAMDFRFLYGQG